MKRYEKELTDEELAALPDEEIDYSDIPELDEEWFRTAKLIMPDEEPKKRITIRLSRDVTEYFRSQAPTRPSGSRAPTPRSASSSAKPSLIRGRTSCSNFSFSALSLRISSIGLPVMRPRLTLMRPF